MAPGKAWDMTLLTLITINAVLCAAVVYGIVLLLGHHGINKDRVQVQAHVQELPRRDTERLAA
jgi:low affinity Fe/Cu permease